MYEYVQLLRNRDREEARFESGSESGSEYSEIQRGKAQLKQDEVFRMRQAVAKQLMLNDQLQTFDTSRLWTLGMIQSRRERERAREGERG